MNLKASRSPSVATRPGIAYFEATRTESFVRFFYLASSYYLEVPSKS